MTTIRNTSSPKYRGELRRSEEASNVFFQSDVKQIGQLMAKNIWRNVLFCSLSARHQKNQCDTTIANSLLSRTDAKASTKMGYANAHELFATTV